MAYESYYNAYHQESADEVDQDVDDREPRLLRAYDLPCAKPCKFFAGVPLPSNENAHDFVIQACRLPVCMPCATLYCYEGRARCVCSTDEE